MSGVWNETAPNGEDSILDAMAMNGQYTTGDIAWITFAAAIVWIMIPGIGYEPEEVPAHLIRFFYAGLARRKSSLALVFQSLMCVSIISFQVEAVFISTDMAVVLLGIFAHVLTYRRRLHRKS